MTCIDPKLDLFNMKAYIKFGENQSISSRDIEGKRNFGTNQGPLLLYKCAKMMCNNPKLDLVNMKAYIKFGGNLSRTSGFRDAYVNLLTPRAGPFLAPGL